MLKYTFTILLFILALNCNADEFKPTLPDLKPSEKQTIITKLIAEMITTVNYKRLPLNDSLSGLIFDRYLKKLDPNHSYFLASDVAGLKTIKTSFDEDLKTGTLIHAFEMFNLYKKRFEERQNFSINLLKSHFDYTKNETFMPSRELLPYFENTVEMNAFWRKKIKYDMLVLHLAGSAENKNRQTLDKRYSNLLQQMAKAKSDDVFQIFINAVTNAVDPHAGYFNSFNASQLNLSLSRTLEGIGATLAVENDFVTITQVVPGGPAYKTQKINLGDRIVAVAQGKDGAFQDIVGWRVEDAIAIIRGQKGTIVKLRIRQKDQSATSQASVVEIVRDKIILDDQSAKKSIKEYSVNGRLSRIGFINIPQFYLDFNARKAGDPNFKSTTRDVKLLIDSLKKETIDGIVIDLRSNGGGSLTEAIDLTGLFIGTGPVVQVRNVKGTVMIEKSQSPVPAYSGPLAVLVDRYSASASEIFSAAIQDYQRGIIIGSRTYGKGTVQSQIDLDDMIGKSAYKEQANKIASSERAENNVPGRKIFGQLNITVGKFYRIKGSSTQHLGVIPDIELPTLVPMNSYGEDNEPSALAWDTIAKAAYIKSGQVDSNLTTLRKLQLERFQEDGLYNYVSAITKAQPQKDEKIPLAATTLKKEQELKDAAKLQLGNQLRKEMGKPLMLKGKTESKIPDLDFIKREAGKVLSDYILIKK